MRRWPLTWQILECTFRRIPLFSLAKSLADRRFINILHQTLKDTSKPIEEMSASNTSKRKRSSTRAYALEELNDREGCLVTGDAIFSALRRLLNRLDDKSTQSSHDRIGAEHIRSLFCTTAAEATTLASLSLIICELALDSAVSDEIEGRDTWIQVISAIWDLHLQGNDDTLEVAIHLFNPSATILGKLNGLPTLSEVTMPEAVKAKWNSDIQLFMFRNLIYPARASYINRQDFEAPTRALEVSKSNISVSALALYYLASGASEQLIEGRSRKANAEWMKEIFKASETAVKEQNNRDLLVQNILERAAERSMPIDNGELRTICREYALKDENTNWKLVADIATCEPDVFQLSEEGNLLLKDVCERSTSEHLQTDEHEAVLKVLNAIIQGFRTSRDFSGFLKLWYEQLSKVEKQKSKTGPLPWVQIATVKETEPLSALVERELSPQQLREVLEWVEAQDSNSKARCLFLSTIAQGIKSETYMEVAGRKLFDLLASVKKTSSTLTSLKWRVVAATMSWVASQERSDIWQDVKKSLSKVLSESPISSRETFEAFKCCCQVWVSMNPDDKDVNQPAEITEKFVARLGAELITAKAFKKASVSPYLLLGAQVEFSEDNAFQHYLAWFLRGSTRLTRLLSVKNGTLPQVIDNAVTSSKIGVEDMRAVWNNLLTNENNVNDSKVVSDLIERLSKTLQEDVKEKKWPGENSQTCIRSLSATPSDAFTRVQREQIMASLIQHTLSTTKCISAEGWKLILGLSTKMMRRPTFYDGLNFATNIQIADAMSNLSSSISTVDGTLDDLIELYFGLVSVTIRQMCEHIDARSIKYFEESQVFISECQGSGDLSPFRLTLLKALAVETKVTNIQNHTTLSSLPKTAHTTLGKCVYVATSHFISDKKAFESHDVSSSLRLFAAVDAARVLDDLDETSRLKKSEARKAEKRSCAAMLSNDIRGWKVQIYLRTYFPSLLEDACPTTFPTLAELPNKLRESLLKDYVAAIMKHMGTSELANYLKDLIYALNSGSCTDGQLLAIQQVVNQLIGKMSISHSFKPNADRRQDETDVQGTTTGFDLAVAQSQLASALASVKSESNAILIAKTLQTLLEKKPQAMTQWNVEQTLGLVSALASSRVSTNISLPYSWLCKLVEVIIKKHRLRLEGHHHILLTTMQTLLRNLITSQAPSDPKKLSTQESKAHLYTRLVTLICEPTAGAVSRSQHQSSLDSATDAAKRSAGRHMYLVLMQYVKLQLETDIPRPIREALEPAVNSVFDITPPEVRKILNDAMDGSGRAILREMYKRYTRFGKWSGV